MDRPFATTYAGLGPLHGHRRPGKSRDALRRMREQIDLAEQELRRTLRRVEPAVDRAEAELRWLGRRAAAGAAGILRELAASLQRIALRGAAPTWRASEG